MEQIRIARKAKANKKINHFVNKEADAENIEKTDDQRKADIEAKFGITLTLDNSLSRFANDPFFVEHTKMVDRKFASKKASQ